MKREKFRAFLQEFANIGFSSLLNKDNNHNVHFQSPVHASCVEILQYTCGNLRACDDLATGILSGILSSCAVFFHNGMIVSFVCVLQVLRLSSLVSLFVKKDQN